MTRIAGDLLRSIESIVVDAANHFEHLSSDHFCILLVAAEVAFNMAAETLQTGPGYKRTHDSADFFGLDQLQVPGSRHAPSSASRTRSGRGGLLTQQR
jgi:hypothetical protein